MRWRTRRGERLWAATSPRARVMLAVGIFAVFSTLGILLDVPRETHAPLPILALYCAICGATAVAAAFVVMWDLRLAPVAIALFVGMPLVDDWAGRRAVALSVPAQHARLEAEAVACFALVVLGYSFLIRFIHSIARGHATLQTEVELARGIHQALVPAVSGRSAHAEYYGSSRPSGAIGGDLVDAVEGPGGTALYVIDVSGHGVRAGVLMAMLKSTARTALAQGASLPTLLAHLNRTICELERSQIFATCAALHVGRAGQVEYALAGHPPILVRRSGTGEVRELGAGCPPLGLDPHGRFTSTPTEAGAGDHFLVVTDGLTEVFGADGRDLGLAGIRAAAFTDGPGTPREIAERVIAKAARFGPQLDDQTVLSIRVLPNAG